MKSKKRTTTATPPPLHPQSSATSGRAGRMTNQLKYLQQIVVKTLWKHNFSWPFQKPVDAEALNLPVSNLCFN